MSAEEENLEKDVSLKQVQARDLIEFGMIPVSFYLFWFLLLSLVDFRNSLEDSLC